MPSFNPVRCLRCGHEWIRRRGAKGVRCARCRSKYWNLPKKINSGPRKPVPDQDLAKKTLCQRCSMLGYPHCHNCRAAYRLTCCTRCSRIGGVKDCQACKRLQEAHLDAPTPVNDSDASEPVRIDPAQS